MTDQLLSPEVAPLSELIDLTGRRALVTGGAQGIGAAIARRLVDAGAVVTIGDIDDSCAARVEAHAHRTSTESRDMVQLPRRWRDGRAPR